MSARSSRACDSSTAGAAPTSSPTTFSSSALPTRSHPRSVWPCTAGPPTCSSTGRSRWPCTRRRPASTPGPRRDGCWPDKSRCDDLRSRTRSSCSAGPWRPTSSPRSGGGRCSSGPGPTRRGCPTSTRWPTSTRPWRWVAPRATCAWRWPRCGRAAATPPWPCVTRMPRSPSHWPRVCDWRRPWGTAGPRATSQDGSRRSSASQLRLAPALDRASRNLERCRGSASDEALVLGTRRAQDRARLPRRGGRAAGDDRGARAVAAAAAIDLAASVGGLRVLLRARRQRRLGPGPGAGRRRRSHSTVAPVTRRTPPTSVPMGRGCVDSRVTSTRRWPRDAGQWRRARAATTRGGTPLRQGCWPRRCWRPAAPTRPSRWPPMGCRRPPPAPLRPGGSGAWRPWPWPPVTPVLLRRGDRPARVGRRPRRRPHG